MNFKKPCRRDDKLYAVILVALVAIVFAMGAAMENDEHVGAAAATQASAAQASAVVAAAQPQALVAVR